MNFLSSAWGGGADEASPQILGYPIASEESGNPSTVRIVANIQDQTTNGTYPLFFLKMKL